MQIYNNRNVIPEMHTNAEKISQIECKGQKVKIHKIFHATMERKHLNNYAKYRLRTDYRQLSGSFL